MPQSEKQGFKAEKKASTSKRPRGAQPGNTNAVKHGFYSRQFRPQEISDLDSILMGNLDDEINMFRIITRRVFDLAVEKKVPKEEELTHWIAAMEALGKASIRQGNLLRTQHMLGGTGEEMIEVIKAALTDITERDHLND
jgi:uncharacterized protein YjcR